MSNLIGWCDMTHNIVWGCNRGCSFCYARNIAKRFADIIAVKEMTYCYGDIWKEIPYGRKQYEILNDQLKAFFPTFLHSHYAQPLPKKPQRIFLDSMSDIADWEEEWYEKILQKINEYKQHTFIILTKRPEVYKRYTFPNNVWLGVTCTTQLMLNQFECDLSNWFESKNIIFISLEPIQEKIKLSLFMKRMINWIIVGPESGNSKNRISVTPEMINPFYDIDIPVYMKSGCSKIIDTPLRQEWPEK